MPQIADPVSDVLTAMPLAKPLQADAWDAFHQSADANELASKLKSMPLPQDVKARLWDLKQREMPSAPAQAPETESPSSGLALASSGQAIPAAAEAAAEFGTNPAVPRAAATAGRVIGGVTSLPAGLSGLGDVQKGVWAGGRSGWFTGKMLQDVARPVSTLLDKAAPVAGLLSKLGGVQGALDLAQMAEPHRQDIGFLGMGHSVPDLEVLQKAVEKGANPGQAAAQIVSGDPKRFGALMTAYMQSRQVK